ncbi:MAG: hypothetical protein EU541_04170 [Promethearchaeota archaeon]|nr:MAG: hypothetical protein EU541_04170 [Candidatus Lokiarchaeota archaeon]
MSEKLEYITTHDINFAKPILNIIQQRLLKPGDLKILSEETYETYENEGFVIGDHSLEQVKEWIQNKKNIIVIARESNKPSNVIGYSVILRTEEIKTEVRKYGEEVIFEDQKYKDLVFNEDFSYLIQIGVDKKNSNQGIGSKMLKEVFELVGTPIISFVIKTPIRNQVSLYVHLKNGFQYFGDYTGDYDSFEFYRSIGLIYMPGNSIKPRKEVEDLMDYIYENYKTL